MSNSSKIQDMANKSGLSDSQWGQLNKILTGALGIKRVKIFGSRATGKYRTGSDVDLAVWQELDSSAVVKLRQALEESTLPYFFDVVDVGSLGKEDKILTAIERDGVEL